LVEAFNVALNVVCWDSAWTNNAEVRDEERQISGTQADFVNKKIEHAHERRATGRIWAKMAARR
jgi:hypothetical protein